MNLIPYIADHLDLIGNCLIVFILVATTAWHVDVRRIKREGSWWGLRDPEPDDEFNYASQSAVGALFAMFGLPLVSYNLLGLVPAIIAGLGGLAIFIRSTRILSKIK
jgi:hypothetical protein